MPLIKRSSHNSPIKVLLGLGLFALLHFLLVQLAFTEYPDPLQAKFNEPLGNKNEPSVLSGSLSICGGTCVTNQDCRPSTGGAPVICHNGRCANVNCPNNTTAGTICYCGNTRGCGQRCGKNQLPLCGDGVSECGFIFTQPGSFCNESYNPGVSDPNYNQYCLPTDPKNGYSRTRCPANLIAASYLVKPDGTQARTQAEVVESCVEANSAPTTSGIVVSNQICQNGAVISGPGASWSGIHSGSASSGINNPLRVRVTYSDNNGINDLRFLQIFLAETSRGTNPDTINLAFAAHGTIDYQSGSPRIVARTSGTSVPVVGNSRTAVCSGTNQILCNIDNLPSAVNAYAHPVSINTLNENNLSVEWDLGFKSNFNGPVRLYARVTDSRGSASSWVTIANWNIDLQAPNTTITSSLQNAQAVVVNYQASDNNGTVTSIRKECASNLLPEESITLQQVFPAIAGTNSRTFTGNSTYTPCFDSQSGQTFYQVNDVSRNGMITFRMTASDIACNYSPSTSANLSLKSPWFTTLSGDAYANQGYRQTTLADINEINNALLPTLHQKIPYIAQYSLMQGINSTYAKPSQFNFLLNNYQDDNDKPRASTNFPDWYTYISNRVDNVLSASQIKTVSESSTFADLTTESLAKQLEIDLVSGGFPGATVKDRVNVIRFQNNLSLTNITCNTKTIFIVEGDLSLNPNLSINDNPLSGIINGCMFVVKGKTIILQSYPRTVNPRTLSATPPPLNTATRYDSVNAFIVTDEFESPFDAQFEGLIINGSVIANKSINFNRDNGVFLNSRTPAEIITYEGGRYINLFGSIIQAPQDFNISEKAFLESF
ncbi:MAG: hypothetical protein QY330_01865 [Candidatus Dojkabacteria bacterium]|uniref:Uncharacterized protein n=1 Tax=Candidatus Dojkabacteria bacterium TaxID=2099670 RepID=A0A952AJE0_9BACT|nr:hypothetical protein [Candidatus Dojkabacteria bacterium]WKZ28334.1 MAG: hypothetical protein QY330_01865 [Candidatus Dojkabacteria bacterium]